MQRLNVSTLARTQAVDDHTHVMPIAGNPSFHLEPYTTRKKTADLLNQQSRQSDPLNTVYAVCDGGILGNPRGKAYGSFQVEGHAIQRRDFGAHPWSTNNTAETQIAAECLEWIAENVMFPHQRHIVIHTDSQMLCGWINGDRNPKSGQVAKLVEFLERFRRQTKAFQSVAMRWHSRVYSVEALGH